MIDTVLKFLKSSMISLLVSLSIFVIHTQLESHEKNDKSHYFETSKNLLIKGLSEKQSFVFLKNLTSIGPRLTGSPQAAAAVEQMHQLMKDIGLENVHLEPVTVNRWVRGAPEEASLSSSIIGFHPLSIKAIGGSIATPKSGISGQVLEVLSFEELQKSKEKAKGKIVFFNRPMDPTLLNTFTAYGSAANQRVQGAVEAARVGRCGRTRAFTDNTD